MVELIVGIAVGAAFAPMWMHVWAFISALPYIKPVVDRVKGFFTS